MNSLPPPARVWGIGAAKAPVIVVFRRGPSRWTRTYVWNTATETLEAGSWFRGSLYPERSALSPDDKLLLYTANNPSKSNLANQRAKWKRSFWHWTALCRPPLLRAMALWDADDGGFSGGGYFTGNRAITLHHLEKPRLREAIIAPPRDLKVTFEWPERTSALLHQLESTGWKLRQSAFRILDYVTGEYD